MRNFGTNEHQLSSSDTTFILTDIGFVTSGVSLAPGHPRLDGNDLGRNTIKIAFALCFDGETVPWMGVSTLTRLHRLSAAFRKLTVSWQEFTLFIFRPNLQCCILWLRPSLHVIAFSMYWHTKAAIKLPWINNIVILRRSEAECRASMYVRPRCRHLVNMLPLLSVRQGGAAAHKVQLKAALRYVSAAQELFEENAAECR